MPLLLFIVLMVTEPPFKETQLKHARVKTAYDEKESVVKKYFSDKNLNYASFHLFIRAFKKEQKLELWVNEKGKDTFSLLNTYDFCSSSGVLGPKRREGDAQIPEGVYEINHFNPLSNYFLSLGVSYPNSSDKILSDKQHPGGSIYIHGNCVTIGCIPITDDKIKEVYVLAVEAKNNGQQKIPIHIFPSRLDDESSNELKREYSSSETVIKYWGNLKTIYQDFESSKKLKKVKVGSKGEYYF